MPPGCAAERQIRLKGSAANTANQSGYLEQDPTTRRGRGSERLARFPPPTTLTTSDKQTDRLTERETDGQTHTHARAHTHTHSGLSKLVKLSSSSVIVVVVIAVVISHRRCCYCRRHHLHYYHHPPSSPHTHTHTYTHTLPIKM